MSQHRRQPGNAIILRKRKPQKKPPLVPPPFMASIVFGKTIRYTASVGIDAAIVIADLATLFVMATGTTTGFSIIGSTLLKKVEAWSPPTPGALVSLQFSQETTNSIGSPSRIKSDVCQSTAVPAYVKLKPPGNSLSGFYITGNATSTAHAIDVVLAEGSILDLHVAITLLDLAAPGQASTLSGATAGVMYARKLLSGDLIPVSFPSI